MKRPALFNINPWPALADGLTLGLAVLVVVALVSGIAQAGLASRLHGKEAELAKIHSERQRIQQRLASLAPAGTLTIEDGTVLLQGEVLFRSGSDELSEQGTQTVIALAPALGQLLASEPDQMVLFGGHTDDVPIATDRFSSNWGAVDSACDRRGARVRGRRDPRDAHHRVGLRRASPAGRQPHARGSPQEPSHRDPARAAVDGRQPMMMVRLARALVPVAHRALSLPPAPPAEDEPLLESALDAIDGFLADPAASRYLYAARSLGALTRLRRRTTQVTTLARRSLDGELARLSTSALLEGELGVLSALPPDPRAGRRLQALGALLEVHRALAVRVRAPETHRAKIVAPDKPQQARKKERRARP